MPNIVEYSATGEITPSDKGIQAAELAGRRIGLFYHQIGSDIKSTADAVEQHMTVMETSELYASGEKLKENRKQAYEAQSALPENRNNPHFVDEFMAETGKYIDEWAKGATTDRTKLLAAEMGAGIRNEVFHYAAGGQAEMDHAHVVDNANDMVNTASAGLFNDPSEANLNSTIERVKRMADATTATIPDVAAREAAREDILAIKIPQLVLARYHGVANSVREQIGSSATGSETESPALKQLDADISNQVAFNYLTPEMQSRVLELRKEAVSQGQELFKSKDATQRKAESDAFDAALLPIEVGMFKPNGSGGVTMAVTPDSLAAVQRAAAMPGAKQHPDRIEALLNAMHTATQDQISGKERTTDQGTYLSLTGRIGSTTNPLTKAEVDQNFEKLSTTDYHFLREAASDTKQANPKINQAITELHRWQEQIKPSIDKSSIYSGIDQSGAISFSHFAWDTENKLRQAIAHGEDPMQAEQRLTDPRGTNSFYPFIPQYQTTNKQGLANVQQLVGPSGSQPIPAAPGTHVAPPPRKPGESIDDYDKRVHQ